ncbi:MAG TPA: hypothetical protein H9759_01075 [Candidatus Dietzia intestinipullorum]|nr:hypothetical protein [Candidatus Dietzia intestinipullorum]
MPQDYGDLATWIGSIGTVAAFAVAYYQIHQERRHRLAREFRDRLAARREHADKVSAWVSGSQVVVANRSGHPIHDVDIALGTIAPGGGGEDTASTHLVVVPPGEHAVDLDRSDAAPHVVRVAFTDSRADRWSREAGKHPERVDQAD